MLSLSGSGHPFWEVAIGDVNRTETDESLICDKLQETIGEGTSWNKPKHTRDALDKRGQWDDVTVWLKKKRKKKQQVCANRWNIQQPSASVKPAEMFPQKQAENNK